MMAATASDASWPYGSMLLISMLMRQRLPTRSSTWASVGTRVPAKAGCKVAAGIEAGNLGIGHLRHLAVAVGGLVHGKVMDHDQVAVDRAMHVEFDTVGAHGEGSGKGRQGVLGGNAPCAAVGKDLG